jgi:hypothetical protein
VRESSGSRQHQLPCRQFLELSAAECRGVHPTRDAFPLPASQPSPCGIARRVLDCHAGSIQTRAGIVRAAGLSADGLRCGLAAVETGQSPPVPTETGHLPPQKACVAGWR